jgi:hypothetical protein
LIPGPCPAPLRSCSMVFPPEGVDIFSTVY